MHANFKTLQYHFDFNQHSENLHTFSTSQQKSAAGKSLEEAEFPKDFQISESYKDTQQTFEVKVIII